MNSQTIETVANTSSATAVAPTPTSTPFGVATRSGPINHDEYDKTYKELMAAQTHLRDRMFQALKYLGKVERDEYVYVAAGSLENTAFLVYAAIKGRRLAFDQPARHH